jgi:PAS domain-containing protein
LRRRRTIDRVNEPDRSAAGPVPDGGAPARRPAGICRGPGHIVIYGNPAFVALFGAEAVGMPARESLLDLPPGAFALLDAVLARGKPLARWIRFGGEEWRMTVAPRQDPGTGEVYGVAFHLRARSDVPVVSDELPDYGPGRRFA